MGESGGLKGSDVLALTSRDNNGGMFGGDGWSGLIGLLAIAGIFGGGFGGFGGNRGTPATTEDVRNAVDQQTLISKLDQQTYGIADSFNSLSNILNNNFRGIDNAICTLGFQNQTGINTLSSQLAKCCCDIERGIDGVNYNMATNTCAITNTMNMNTRDIIDNQNANYRALHDEIVANRFEDLKEENRRLAERNNSLELRASQKAQTCEIKEYVQDQINPRAFPSYIVPNPNCCYNYSVNGFGYGNNACGCGGY